MANNIVTIPSIVQRDFVWSFKPIIYVMRMMGIELNVLEKHSMFRRIALLLFGVSIFLCTETAFFYQIHFAVEKAKLNTLDKTLKFQLNVGGIIFIAYPIVAFSSALFKWKPVWKKLRKMEEDLRCPPAFYRKQRQVLIALLTPFLISVPAIVEKKMANNYLLPFFFPQSILHPVFRIQHFTREGWVLLAAVLFQNFYINSFVVLFVSLTCLVSMSIQSNIEDVQCCSKIPYEISTQITKWKQSYASIYRLINEMDNFFGPILINYFLGVFYYFIFLPIEILEPEAFQSDAQLVNAGKVLRILQEFFSLSLVVFSTEKMKEKVSPSSK